MKQNRLLLLLAMLFVVFVVSAQTHNVTRSSNEPSKPSTTTTKKKNNNKTSTTNKIGGKTGKTSGKESTNKKQQTITTPKKHTQRDSQGRIQSVVSTPSSSQTSRNPIIDNLVNNMVYVDGGTFTMGATSEQGNDALYFLEKPTHQVTLSSFSIGRYEVTQKEWQAVMGSNPSKFKGDKRPVENVSWDDCQEFILKLNSMTGKSFRLPTEAEWEFAARGGKKSNGYKYAGGNDISTVAWYEDNSDHETHSVGQKKPNELGIYDMAGNVWEWCYDKYSSYSSISQINPTGVSSNSECMKRGGSWFDYAGHCRVSYRGYHYPDYQFYSLGLRLALSSEDVLTNEMDLKIYDVVEQPPSFPGGQRALLAWLSNNIQYPSEAENDGIQGRVVVSYIVEPDGSINNVQVVRHVDPLLDNEAVRVVKAMPRWIPGVQDGHGVRVKYNLPVTFKLQ